MSTESSTMDASGLGSLDSDVIDMICCMFLNEKPRKPMKFPRQQSESDTPLKNLSLTSRYMRNLAAPLLFTNIYIAFYIPPWPAVGYEWLIESLERMKTSSLVRCYGKSFKLLAPSSGAGFELEPDSFPSLQKIATLAAEVLTGMEKLESLTLRICPSVYVPLNQAFAEQQVKLPSVRNLYLGPFSSFAISHCPNTTSIAMQDPGKIPLKLEREASHQWTGLLERKFIAAAGIAQNLQSFSMCTEWIEPRRRELAKAMPNIVQLRLLGKIPPGKMEIGGPYFGDPPYFFFIDMIAELPKLRHLILSPKEWLPRREFLPPLGYCFFYGEEGASIRERLGLPEPTVVEENVGWVLGAMCPSLKVIEIGTDIVEIQRGPKHAQPQMQGVFGMVSESRTESVVGLKWSRADEDGYEPYDFAFWEECGPLEIVTRGFARQTHSRTQNSLMARIFPTWR